MNCLRMIVATLFLSILLAACGEDKETPKPAPVKTNNILDQTKAKLDKAAKTNDTNLKNGIENGESGAEQK